MKKLIILLALMMIATVSCAQEPEVTEYDLTINEGGTMEGSSSFSITIDGEVLQNLVNTNAEATYALIVSITPKEETP